MTRKGQRVPCSPAMRRLVLVVVETNHAPYIEHCVGRVRSSLIQCGLARDCFTVRPRDVSGCVTLAAVVRDDLEVAVADHADAGSIAPRSMPITDRYTSAEAAAQRGSVGGGWVVGARLTCYLTAGAARSRRNITGTRTCELGCETNLCSLLVACVTLQRRFVLCDVSSQRGRTSHSVHGKHYQQ